MSSGSRESRVDRLRPLLAGAGGVGLQRADALGERAAAFGGAGGGGRW